MRKILCFSWIMLLAVTLAWAQQTTNVKFVGQDQYNNYIRLSSVQVENLTHRWQDVLYYPDTVMHLGQTGVSEFVENEYVGLLSQNMPNPFDGVTEVVLTTEAAGAVSLKVADMTGRCVASYLLPTPTAGSHLLRLYLASPQIYILNATQNGQMASIKMANTGYAGMNRIEYGGPLAQLKVDPALLRSAPSMPFAIGDAMKYTAYAQVLDRDFQTLKQTTLVRNGEEKMTFSLPYPTVTTRAVTNVTSRSATFNGAISASDNSFEVIGSGFLYGTSSNTNANRVEIPMSGDGTISAPTTGLMPNITYFYKAYATTGAAEVYGNMVSFTTQKELPQVETDSVIKVTMSQAEIASNVVFDGGVSVTSCGVCWGTSSNPTVDGNHTTDGSGMGSYISKIMGLRGDTYYIVRAYATNSEGTSYGEQRGFYTLPPVAPTITTAEVSEVTGYTAVCGGNITDDGGADVTARGVCWSTSHNPTISNSKTADGTGIGSYTSSMTDLTPGTTYYVRAYATNSVGTSYGEEKSFTTLAMPLVTTASVSNITEASSTCGGNVTADGGATVIARGVCWSTTPNPTISDSKTADGTGTGSFASSLTGLTSGTTYYVRAYATNSVGTSYGEERSFTTLIEPTVTTNAVSNVKNTTATCGGNVTSDGGTTVIARGVCWSTKPTPTISNSKTTNGTGTGSYTSSMTGLTPGTTYYVRAYATNSVGTSYGEERSFTTLIEPTVTTSAVSSIASTTATCGGNVTADGGATVTARGVCWSTSHNPTISNSKTTNGTGTGSYTSSMTGLTPGTTYYVRAYATNSVGTSYGEERSFTTLIEPTVTTNAVSSIASTTATCGGNVTSDGGATVTARGVCWSTTPNPTISNSKTTNGTGTGSFTSSMTGLTPGTTYYVRAYATNSVGTSYGEGKSFTTPVLPTVTTNAVSSIAGTTATCGGNVSSDGGATVTARGVCWNTSPNPTISNSKTTNGTGTGSYTSSMTGLTPGTTYYVRAYATNSVGTAYGEEKSFTTLAMPSVTTASVNNITETSAICGGNVMADGGATVIARGVCWSTSYNPTVSDSKTADGTGVGSYTSSLTGLTSGTTYYVRAYATNSVGTAYGEEKSFTTLAMPSVTTASVSNITETSATCGGNVTADGGATVTARGVCWSTSHNPTTSNSKTTNGTGTGSYTSSLTGLTAGTTYYVRAYATNSVGTAYGNEVSLTTKVACGTTIKDKDNNTYNTVKIGNQCWMKENLKTTKYADGTSISQGSSTSTTKAYWYYPNNSSSNKATYGLLYNWKAVMRNSSSSSANPSGVQGICPTGWHVPSDAEWTQLTDYVSSQSKYRCNSNSENIAKALASTSGWSTSSATCTVGKTQSGNNATGFSAFPAGDNRGSSYFRFGLAASFWGSTVNNGYACYRSLDFNATFVLGDGVGGESKDSGFSVRCLRD